MLDPIVGLSLAPSKLFPIVSSLFLAYYWVNNVSVVFISSSCIFYIGQFYIVSGSSPWLAVFNILCINCGTLRIYADMNGNSC